MLSTTKGLPMKWKNLLYGLALTLFLVPASSASLYSQSSFYQGKTITVIVSSDAGGTVDMRVKALAPVLRKYIPGNPIIVTEYMPGGGGRKAANHLYRSVRPDGLTIGSMSTTLVAAGVLGESGVLYNIDRFIYLGAPDGSTQHVFLTRKELGLSTLDKLRAAPGLRIGAQSIGHQIYIAGRVFAFFIGLKEPKFVVGYTGPEIDLALNRGEVDARAHLVGTVMQRTPELVEKGLADFHAVLETPKGNRHPRFAHLPELESFAKSDKERRLLSLQRTLRLTGSTLILPPGTAKEPAEVLQEGMRKAFKDPAFLEAYRKATGEDATPVMPEDLQRIVKEVPRDPEIVGLFNRIAGPESLPDRLSQSFRQANTSPHLHWRI
jgi:tripartite-type tricarboxylate transporter receptor subunit TctC